jgi:Amt family ammonium transporter
VEAKTLWKLSAVVAVATLLAITPGPAGAEEGTAKDAPKHQKKDKSKETAAEVEKVAAAPTEAPAVKEEPAAAAAPKFDTGDTAWMLTSSALVLMMTIPGLALFYGGLVRSKNVLSTLMHSFFCAALISVTWVLFGYSLAFGPDVGGIIGSTANFGLANILGTANSVAPTIPAMLFVVYQATFAIITPALISGTFAERMRFPAFALFMLLWSTLIYNPLAHWVWGGGWIGAQVGALDFAGGTVVHISSGISALVTAMYLGKRDGYPQTSMAPHNLPYSVIGASLLWVGWFGFNAGSAVSSSELAATAFVNTNTAAAAATLGWMAAEWMRNGKPTMLGGASGAVAGLVAVTPAAGFVTPMASVVIGILAGVICYTAVSLKPRFGYDDTLDVVGVHMIGGTLGAMLTGVFATKLVNSAIPTLTLGLDGGLLYGYPALMGKQFIAVLATYVFCGIGTFLLLTIINAITPLRAPIDDERMGMDLSQHSETAYTG